MKLSYKRRVVRKEKANENRFQRDGLASMKHENQFSQLSHSDPIVAVNLIPGNQFATSLCVTRFFYKLSLLLSAGWWWSLDLFLSQFIKTTKDSNVSFIPFYGSAIFKGLLSFVLLLILSPFALFGLFLWLPLQFVRPRAFSYYVANYSDGDLEKYHLLDNTDPSYNKHVATSNADGLCTTGNAKRNAIEQGFCVLTCNVCLMPEFTSKINNLTDVNLRAKKISQHIISSKETKTTKSRTNKFTSGFRIAMESEMLVPVTSSSTVELKDNDHDFEIYDLDGTDLSSETQSVASAQLSVTSKELAVSESLPPNIDFLCLQEVFDASATKILLKRLSKTYNYIVYDAWLPYHDGRFTLLNSGLCIASKYPIMDVDFKAFPNGYREDKFACKGLLMAKIYVGEISKNHTQVGYIATTHLQAITHPHASNIRCQELNLILEWMEEFKQREQSASSVIRETVLFDVICGDFNFDMESHFEENERNCTFRQIYRDPCMNEMTGQQHNWVVGTSLIEQNLHHNVVCTPIGLQKMMISELERSKFVYSTKPSNSTSINCADGRRRIDYILFKPCKEKTLVLKDYKFHTTLAGLTDHIPVSMSFNSVG